MAYEALYRRYRPGRFEDMIGQDHVFATLKNALMNDRVGHAYLFSGPRGTGKTSSARILAKALNCTNLQDGEPCDECDSCVAFQSNQSYDLYELDAASNNGVDAMRDLIQKVALGSPGRQKVYILDEVHMLSTGAENALLKTLEEPPAHVTFVLCTTEPNKVVSTIRSRTQHLEFRLYPAEELADLARSVAADAGLDVSEAGIAHAVRAAQGSARDMLSALDQVAAAGGVPDDDDQISSIIDAIAAEDTGAALTSVNEATRLGRDPEVIGRALLTDLRNAFLASMGADLGQLSENDASQATRRAGVFRAAALTRAIESIGTAIVDMRQAPDPRVDLEVVLVRLTRPTLDTDVAALVARVERLEQGLPPATAPSSSPTPVRASAPSPAPAPAPAPSPPSEVAPPSASAPATTAPPSSVAEPAEAAPSGPTGARPADLARRNLPPRRGANGPTAVAPAAPEGPAGSTNKPTLGSLRRAAQSDGPAVAVAVAPSEADPAPAPEPAPDLIVPVPSPQPAPAQAVAPSAAAAATAPEDRVPDLAAVVGAWNDGILAALPGSVKARFSAGQFRRGADGLEFALPNGVHRDRCEAIRDEVDQAFVAHFGTPVPIALVVGDHAPAPTEGLAPTPPTADELLADEIMDVHELADATDEVNNTIVDRIEEIFPGSEIVETES